MLDKTALILIAHSDWRALMAFYTLLDAEGYFVAPCFSEGDLLTYCERYQPELVITSDPLSGKVESRLLEGIKERSPTTRIILLPDGIRQAASGAFPEPESDQEVLRSAETLRFTGPPLPLNGH